MKLKKALTYVAAGVVLVIVVAVILIFGRGKNKPTAQVILPSTAVTQTQPPVSDAEPTPTENAAGVATDTVQAVIAAMTRQDTYMRTLTVTNYWEGGYSQSAVTVWVSGDKTRIQLTPESGEQKHVLIKDGSLWIWYGDGSAVYTGPASGMENYDADTFQGIISYEDILRLDLKDIHKAEYTTYLNDPCVYVEYSSGELGYTTMAYIAVDSGLLVGAETYDGEVLVYSMETLSYESTVTSEEVFTPPGE